MILAALAAAFLTSPASAQTVCGKRADILGKLEAKYSETPVAMSLMAPGYVLELLAAPEGKTWTMIYTTPQGVTCLHGSGEFWQPIEPKGPGA